MGKETGLYSAESYDPINSTIAQDDSSENGIIRDDAIMEKSGWVWEYDDPSYRGLRGLSRGYRGAIADEQQDSHEPAARLALSN
jgi:hypothetical protein